MYIVSFLDYYFNLYTHKHHVGVILLGFVILCNYHNDWKRFFCKIPLHAKNLPCTSCFSKHPLNHRSTSTKSIFHTSCVSITFFLLLPTSLLIHIIYFMIDHSNLQSVNVCEELYLDADEMDIKQSTTNIIGIAFVVWFVVQF